MRTTILDAVVAVLEKSPTPVTVQTIHSEIVRLKLFTFGAKDEIAIVRAAIRRHIKAATAGQAKARVKTAGKDSYALIAP